MMTTNSNEQQPNSNKGKLKAFLYAIGVFCVFMALTYILRLVTGKYPENFILLGVYQSSDLWLGAAIAVILTYSRYLKRNIGKK